MSDTMGPKETEPAQAIMIEVPPGLEEIVPGYLLARREELPRMMTLLAASDFRRLAVLCHDLKGTGASYGFPALTKMGGALEQSARQSNAKAMAAQLKELTDYLRRVQLLVSL